MRWRSFYRMPGWGVALVDRDGEVLGFASINQFGRLRHFAKHHPSPLGAWQPGWEALDAAATAARSGCPPYAGRYCGRHSTKRGELCELIAAALNHAGVFPPQAVAA